MLKIDSRMPPAATRPPAEAALPLIRRAPGRDDGALNASEQALRQQAQGRKAAASDRLEYLKRMMQILFAFGGGDPKGLVRQLAQLARELGVAVREYASAGDSGPPPPAEAPPTGDPQADFVAAVTRDAAAIEGEGQAVRAAADFMADARALHQQLHSLLQQARRQARERSGKEDGFGEAGSALDGVAAALAELETSGGRPTLLDIVT